MFDPVLCYHNIKVLAHKKGIKLGEIEAKSGVSQGYFSVVSRNGSSPSINTLFNTAEILGVTLDTLTHELPLEESACPFCRHDNAYVVTVRDGTAFQVECPNCGGSGSIEVSKREAIKAWNNWES